MYVTILMTVKLPTLPLLLSIALMPAENHTHEKANQNSSEVALHIHRQKAACGCRAVFSTNVPINSSVLKPRTWVCSKKRRGVLAALYSAFPEFVGRNLAFPQHLSPSAGIPKDFGELHTVIPGAGTCGTGQTTRLTVHKTLAERRDYGRTLRGSTKQSNCISRQQQGLPSLYISTRSSRAKQSTLFLQPTLPQAFSPLSLCKLSTDPCNSLPLRFPSETAPSPAAAPGRPLAFPSCSRSPPGAGAAGPLCSHRSHAPAGPRGTARSGHRATAAGRETLIYLTHTYIHIYTYLQGFFFFPPLLPPTTGAARAVTTPGDGRLPLTRGDPPARPARDCAHRGSRPVPPHRGTPALSRPAPPRHGHLPRSSREASCGRRVRMAAGARGGGRPYLPPRGAAGRRLPGQASRRARRHKGKAAGPARGGAKAGGGIAPAAGRPPRLPSAPTAPAGEAGGEREENLSSKGRKK